MKICIGKSASKTKATIIRTENQWASKEKCNVLQAINIINNRSIHFFFLQETRKVITDSSGKSIPKKKKKHANASFSSKKKNNNNN